MIEEHRNRFLKEEKEKRSIKEQIKEKESQNKELQKENERLKSENNIMKKYYFDEKPTEHMKKSILYEIEKYKKIKELQEQYNILLHMYLLECERKPNYFYPNISFYGRFW